MRIALCNEVLMPLAFARQCALAAELGYDGLEIAPFTLGTGVLRSGTSQRARWRRAAADAGIGIVGLHWLLVQPQGLSITSADGAQRDRTLSTMRSLIDLCADLGGTVMVHGSPAQRRLVAGDELAAVQRGIDALARVAEHAERAGVIYCIEPLASTQTDFINTVQQAVDIVRAIGKPALRTMLDCSAAALEEVEAPAALLEHWLPSGLLAHVQLNDPNLRGPGQGALQFGPIMAMLRRHGYGGWVSVEPFEYQPDGPTCAARAIGYVRGLLEALP